MAAFPTEDRLRQKRTKSEQAIALAMKNRWDEAAQVNREILDMFPNEVDAYNRLGKALTELGRYGEARDAYAQAVKLDPLNGIASKNLQRLDLGNQYAVFVTAANEQSVHVIIRETHRSAAMGHRPSFRPSAAPEGGVRAYTREGVLRYELEEEEEEEEELGEEEEEEAEVVPADLEVGVEETPLEALAAEEDTEEPS